MTVRYCNQKFHMTKLSDDLNA